ncbi:hypothetical protein WJX72_011990 [[Myrmecia] bisecta]|uniref:AP2/ERF domain-containing protein n=1 Tax=[Myrmecia] bisecta TaxID=41462 RepID=A0AAW1PH08_9CHLO
MGKSSLYRGVTLFRPTGKWRAQISASGKTTSLGDHDTEEDAARAFDRAAINKAGLAAKTNFDVQNYIDEVEDLQSMSQTELVAMLRSRARKSGTQTSHYRGVSLLKQTGKWHAQINVGGKQVHLGFFPSEEAAARAYDRAAINKGARDGGKIITNFDLNDYERELEVLGRISQDELVAALGSESRRRATMEMLSEGFAEEEGKAEEVFGRKMTASSGEGGSENPHVDVAELRLKAERAQPKPTAKEPLYAHFGKKKEPAATAVATGNATDAAAASVSRTASPVNTPPASPALARRPRPRANTSRAAVRDDSPDPPYVPSYHLGIAPASPSIRPRRARKPRQVSPPSQRVLAFNAEQAERVGQLLSLPQSDVPVGLRTPPSVAPARVLNRHPGADQLPAASASAEMGLDGGLMAVVALEADLAETQTERGASEANGNAEGGDESAHQSPGRKRIAPLEAESPMRPSKHRRTRLPPARAAAI